jgi:hypothetical protein
MEALKEESNQLREAKELLQEERDKLCSYIMKSARNRVKAVKSGSHLKAIRGEIAVSNSFERLDLIQNLLGRGETLSKLEERIADLEKEDYERRFGSGLPPEAS